MKYSVVDIETDNLYDEVTRIHCISYQIFDCTTLLYSGTLTDYASMRKFILEQEIIVGHNFIMYDKPVIEKLLGIIVTARIIDSLPLSWYLYPMQKEHGLEYWGTLLGVPKPVIGDWQNLTLAEYVFRCESDVEINARLFHKQMAYLQVIYQGNSTEPIIHYLCFKQDCMLEQFFNPLKINREVARENYDKLLPVLQEKILAVESAMPEVVKYDLKARPKKCYKKDGSLSSLGEGWFNLLFEMNVSPDLEEIRVVKEVQKPKYNSPIQVKAWLTSLGWEPTMFKYEKNKKTGQVRAVPQISDKDMNLCPNILSLAEANPAVKSLEGLYMVKHRLDILKSFMELGDVNDCIRAETLGLTNTLRFKHKKPIVNLPGVNKPYGKEIRSCIIAPGEDYLFCGSDMSSLEDTTKQHYIYFYDPEYVKEMRVPGFDPHISMGVFANMITKEDEVFFKWYTKEFENDDNYPFTQEEKARYKGISLVRKDSKVVNFSAVYGVGAAKMSLGTKWPISKSKELLAIYWKRNWAVKEIAKDCTIRIVFKNGSVSDYFGRDLIEMPREHTTDFFEAVGQMWLYNPVSGLYYSLRYPKDIFSTLNQGTGVYCFDIQVRNVRRKGIKISLQYHDEKGFPLLKSEKDEVKRKLHEAIEETNKELQLNVPLGISVEFGSDYSSCH